MWRRKGSIIGNLHGITVQVGTQSWDRSELVNVLVPEQTPREDMREERPHFILPEEITNLES